MDFSNHRFSSNRQLPIGKESSKPIANRQLVDTLLETYAELITPSYKKWFAKRFYLMSADDVARCASEAKADGRSPAHLFTTLIKDRSA